MEKRLNFWRKAAALATAATLTVTAMVPTFAMPNEQNDVGAEIYVAVNGNDETGTGSIDAPFATLERARQAAREEKQDAGSATIWVRGGEYFFDKTFEMTNEDSGISIKAYNNEDVTFSGSKDLGVLEWSDYEGNPAIKVAQVDTNLGIDQLYVNKEDQVLARYPNYEEGKLPLGGATTRANIKSRVANYEDPTGGYLRAIHSNGWGGNDYIITGKDSSNALGLSYEWVGDNNRGNGMQDNVVIENVFEELDAPNEWYYDNESGLLYYYPGEGVDLSASDIEGAVTSELISISGTDSSNPVTDITLDGIDYFGTKRTMFTIHEEGKEYIPLMRSDWCVVRAGAVYMENTKNIQILNSNFNDMGGNGVFMYGYNDSNVIDNSEFIDIGATAVQIVGSSNAVDDPSFWSHALYPDLQVHATTVKNPDHIGPVTEDYPRDIVISNNHMENMGIFEKQSCGVNMSVSSRIKVLHNTIHKSARSDINVCDGTFGGHEIAYNDVYDAQLETSDHGQFNSWGRDRFWSVPNYNASGNNGDLLRHYEYNGQEYDVTQIDAYQTTKIHDNRFHHDSDVSTWGIDLDDGSSNYEIYNNLCLGMGIKLREGFDRKVYNNIILDGQFQIHVSYTEANDEIHSNIVCNSTPFGFASVDENRFKNAGYVVDNNWYFDYGTNINLPSWFHVNKSSNDYDANALIDVDPGFENPRQNNYTVTNTEAMEQVGFVNFPMDQFGKPGCECESPIYAKIGPGEGGSDILQRETWKGAIISNVDDAIMSATASTGYDGAYFEEVPEDSEAYAMGFRTRDIVKVVNGVTLGDKSTFITEFNKIPDNAVGIMEVHRTNQMQTFSFTKVQGVESVIECNDSAVRYSGEVSDDLFTQNGWYYDERPMGDLNNTICAYPDSEGTASAWAEVDFTGTQISYITRKHTDQGQVEIVITNRDTGNEVARETVDCSTGNRLYAQTVYTSPTLPQGNYTMHLSQKSGKYFIIDAFKVYGNKETDVNLVTDPSTVQYDNGNNVETLIGGETLNITTPFNNNASSDLNGTVIFQLLDINGGYTLEDLATDEITIPANGTLEYKGSYVLPEDVNDKMFRMIVLDENGTVMAYSTTIKGGDFELPVTIPAAGTPAGELSVSYDKETRLMKITAEGLIENTQAILTAIANENTVMVDQVKTQGTAAAFAFKLPENFEKQELTMSVKGELCDAIITTIAVNPDENIINKLELDAAIAAAKELTETDYTRNSWYHLEVALAEAEKISASQDANQEDVNLTTEKLNAAMNELVSVAKTIEVVGDNEFATFGGNGWTHRGDGNVDSATNGDSYTYTFSNALSIEWFGVKGSDHGIADVQIVDSEGNIVEGSAQTIDCYISGRETDVSLYKFKGLDPAETYRFEFVINGKNTNASNYYVEVYRFVIEQYNETAGDKSELQVLYDSVKNLEQGNYTQETWDVLVAARDTAKAILDDERAADIEIANALTDLQSAISGLTEEIPIEEANKTNLKFYLDKANALDPEVIDSLVASAQTKFTAALENGRKIYDDAAATQEEVNAAAKELRIALNMLSMVAGNKDALNDLISEAEDLIANVGSDYPQNAIDDLQDAIDAAKEVANDGDAFQADVDKAVEDLQDAMEAFNNSKLDWRALEAAVADAADVQTDINNHRYVEDSEAFKAFEEAYAAAQELLNSKIADNQESIDNATTALLEACANLRYKADKETLKAVVNDAETVDVTLYTAESVALFRSALAAANTVLIDESLSMDDQVMVDNATVELKEAIAALVPIETATNSCEDNTNDMTTGAIDTANSTKTGDVNPLPIALAVIVLAAGVGFVFQKKVKK